MRRRACLLSLLLSFPVAGSRAGDDPGAAAVTAVLPPIAPWDGASRALAVEPGDPWATPFEASGLRETPRYDETVQWLARLAAAAPQIEMVTIGRSPEGREIVMMVASASEAKTAEALHASGKPIVLVQAGIHSGEIDGKDAGMMLLRDMTVRGTRRALLDKVSVLFIPILSVDAHERYSEYARVNQRGPTRMGWRTNARNQNLNRDYAKLDTPEIRAVVRAVREWGPDLYVDVHVTDGIDWQYDITWGYTASHGYSRAAAGWLATHLDPAARKALEASGHVPGPVIFPVDERDLGRGFVEWTASPRFSNGWGDARHLPTVLVENHSLKPFDRRVLGTYVFLDAVLETLGESGTGLRAATESDRTSRPAVVPLSWRVPDASAPATGEVLGVEQRLEASPVSGVLSVEYTGRPVTLTVPLKRNSEPDATARPPVAYWIPPAWPEVIERLELQGIEMERIPLARRVKVEMYRLSGAKLDPEPFEGHARVTARATPERREEPFPAGSVRIPVDQPLGVLAVLLLEPDSEDSLFQWGFFLEVLQRAEYVESYVMEPTARRMLDSDPELAAAFRRRLLDDPGFAADATARLQWFYERTPYFDERFNLYPVAREID